MRVILVVPFALLVLATPLIAKRGPEPTVAPIHHNGIVYTATPTPDKMGIVEARHESTGKKLWSRRIYRVFINPFSEHDVQWIFINAMSLKGNSLFISNERNERFSLDLATMAVKRLSITNK